MPQDPSSAPTGPVRRRVISGGEKPTISLAESQARRRAETKEKFLQILDEHLGIISYAAAQAGISRRIVYEWMDNDPEFQRRVKEIDHKQVDFVERKLLENVKSNDTRAITFYLSTKGRHRGYTTRVEVMTPPGESVRTEVSGSVTVDSDEARDEMGDRALGKALKAALKAGNNALNEAVAIALSNGQVDRVTDATPSTSGR